MRFHNFKELCDEAEKACSVAPDEARRFILLVPKLVDKASSHDSLEAAAFMYYRAAYISQLLNVNASSQHKKTPEYASCMKSAMTAIEELDNIKPKLQSLYAQAEEAQAKAEAAKQSLAQEDSNIDHTSNTDKNNSPANFFDLPDAPTTHTKSSSLPLSVGFMTSSSVLTPTPVDKNSGPEQQNGDTASMQNTTTSSMTSSFEEIDSSSLVSLLACTLLIDTRAPVAYRKGHIQSLTTTSHICNMPLGSVGKGSDAQQLGGLLQRRTEKEDFEKRDTFERVVVVTYEGEAPEELEYIWDALMRFDGGKAIRHAPFLLKGGYLDFYQSFQAFCSGGHTPLKSRKRPKIDASIPQMMTVEEEEAAIRAAEEKQRMLEEEQKRTQEERERVAHDLEKRQQQQREMEAARAVALKQQEEAARAQQEREARERKQEEDLKLRQQQARAELERKQKDMLLIQESSKRAQAEAEIQALRKQQADMADAMAKQQRAADIAHVQLRQRTTADAKRMAELEEDRRARAAEVAALRKMLEEKQQQLQSNEQRTKSSSKQLDNLRLARKQRIAQKPARAPPRPQQQQQQSIEKVVGTPRVPATPPPRVPDTPPPRVPDTPPPRPGPRTIAKSPHSSSSSSSSSSSAPKPKLHTSSYVSDVRPTRHSASDVRPSFDRATKPDRALGGRSDPALRRAREDSMQLVHSSHRTLAGLRNLGNTCFMNSVLQCLFYTTPLSLYFVQGRYRGELNRRSKLGCGGKLAEEFAELVKVQAQQRYRSFSPAFFKHILGQFAPDFAGFQQQDAQEFASFLLDGLHEDLSRVVNKPPGRELHLQGLPHVEAADQAWRDYKTRENSIIVDLFHGQFKSSVRCETCQYESSTFTPFTFLSLPLLQRTQRTSLGACLKHFSKKDRLSWNCPRCQCERSAIKSMAIWRLPAILMIHMKRFTYDGPFRDKLNTHVDFPRELDMREHLDASSPGSSSPSSRHSLFGVVNHYGNLSGGHYIAFCKEQSSQKWFKFDDAVVEPMRESALVSSAAYVLFYSSIDMRALGQL